MTPSNISSSSTTHSNTANIDASKVDNFFALFDIAVDFDVDNDALEQRMRDLQQQYHPDNFSDSSSTSDDNLDNTINQNSALINHAYQTLRYPDTRASYLLQMQNQDADLNNSISDLEFLESAMNLRVELDESESTTLLSKLVSTVNSKIDVYAKEFKSAYQNEQWQSAIDITQKLKFLVKLLKDIDKKIDTLLTVDDDDDDLYV